MIHAPLYIPSCITFKDSFRISFQTDSPWRPHYRYIFALNIHLRFFLLPPRERVILVCFMTYNMWPKLIFLDKATVFVSLFAQVFICVPTSENQTLPFSILRPLSLAVACFSACSTCSRRFDSNSKASWSFLLAFFSFFRRFCIVSKMWKSSLQMRA